MTSDQFSVEFDSNTGAFSWTPGYDQGGEHTFTFTAIDSGGLSHSQDVTVTITNVNRTPSLAVSSHSVVIGEELNFVLQGTDPDNETLTYKGIGLPEGARLNSQTGEFIWTPNPGQIGKYTVTFQVSDGEATISKSVVLSAGLTPLVPDLNLILTPSFPVRPGQTTSIRALGDGIITLEIDSQLIEIESPEAFLYTPTSPGQTIITATLTTADGQTSTTTKTLKILDPSDQTPPLLSLLPLCPLRLCGSLKVQVEDTNLSHWTLEVENKIIAQGNTPIEKDFNLDLPSGFYEVGLEATDIGGRRSMITETIEINSQEQPPVTDWSFLEGNVSRRGAETRREGGRLYLTTPSGERVGFTFAPEEQGLPGVIYYEPKWTSESDYELSSRHTLLSRAGNRYYDLVSARPYEPDSYTLTDREGTVYHYDSTGKLLQQIRTDGVRLSYSDAGITSSTGEYVKFQWNELGLLSEVQRDDGTRIVYRYNDEGQLVGRRNVTLGEWYRYGYDEAGNLITPMDLGGASQFSGKTYTGSGTQTYSFSLTDSELVSTATGVVLLGVQVTGDESLVPEISGLTPLVRQSDASNSSAIFAIESEGLNLLELEEMDYTFELTVLGDGNGDKKVNALDSYENRDWNGDGIINEVDVQILASNYGFTANLAPVVTSTSVLTHVDLPGEVDLSDLARDPEGDKLFYRVMNPTNGTVRLGADGKTAIFAPTPGYREVGSFELLVDDGLSSAAPVTVTMQVSDAPLVNLDFGQRNPKLEVGETTQLWAVGDFGDQENVLLPGDYLTWRAENGIVNVSEGGWVTGLENGTAILRASRDGIEAVTATRVGVLESNTEAEFTIELAEQFGLDVFPQTATMTVGTVTQIYVSLAGGLPDEPDLSTEESGTRYFIGDSEIAVVDPNGILLARSPGVTQLTIIHGGAEAIIPLQVVAPMSETAVLGVKGGIVESEIGGYQVILPPGALSEETRVSISALNQEDLELELPFGGELDFIGAFSVDVGEQPTQLPLQFVLPAPDTLTANDIVLILREGLIPNPETGSWEPGWVGEDLAGLTPEGTLRTQLFPAPGSYGGAGVQNYIVLSFPIPEPYLQGAAALQEMEATVTNPVNLPPTASLTAALSTSEITANDDFYILDGNLAFGVGVGNGVLSNDENLPPLEDLTVTVVDEPLGGTLNFNEDGSFQFIPDLDFSYAQFTYRIDDGTTTSEATVYLESSNADPEAADDSYELNEDETFVVLAHEGVLVNDRDPDEHNQLVPYVVTEPQHGFVTLNGNGSFTYTPILNYFGTDSFIYEVRDGRGGSDTGRVNLTINSVNDAPIARGDGYRTFYTETLEVSAEEGLLRNDIDVDEDNLSISITQQPEHGTVTLRGNGAFSYKPDGEYLGLDTFEYQIDDGNGGTDTAVVSISNYRQPFVSSSIYNLPIIPSIAGLGLFSTMTFAGYSNGLGAGLVLTRPDILYVGFAVVGVLTIAALYYHIHQSHGGSQLITYDENNFIFSSVNETFYKNELRISATVQQPVPSEINPQTPPLVDRVELSFEHVTEHGPVLFIEGTNILAETSVSPLGGAFEDITVEFDDGHFIGKAIPIDELSQKGLGGGRQKLAVPVPNSISLGDAIIEVVRPVGLLNSPSPEPKRKEVRSVSFEVPSPSSPLSFTLSSVYISGKVLVRNDKGNVAQILLPEDSVARSLAITPNNSRIYVGLAQKNQIVVIDPLSLQKIDAVPETEGELITLSNPSARIGEIVINPNGKYAYISDIQGNQIYILDIVPTSDTYHQVVGTITTTPAEGNREGIYRSRLQQMTFSSDGRLLFVTRSSVSEGSSRIIVINVDPADEGVSGNDFHGIITNIDGFEGKAFPRRIFSIATTPEPNKIALTFRGTGSSIGQYGVLSYEFTDSGFKVTSFKTIHLGLGPTFNSLGADPLLVNDPQEIIIQNVQYGQNGESETLGFILGSGFTNTQRFLGSSNIGIIANPLGENPELIAATTPIPYGLGRDITIDGGKLNIAFNVRLQEKGAGIVGTSSILQSYSISNLAEIVAFAKNNSALKEELANTPIDILFKDVIIGADGRELDVNPNNIEPDHRAQSAWNRGRYGDAGTQILSHGTPLPIQIPHETVSTTVKPVIPQFTELPPLPQKETETEEDPKIQEQREELERIFGKSNIKILPPIFRPPNLEPETEPETELEKEKQKTKINSDNLEEIALFISTHPEGEGLFPGEKSFVSKDTDVEKNKLSRPLTIGRHTYDDYNPNRVLTAKGTVKNGIIT